jgi:DNA-directed RNA polymerase I subunit RPA2
MTTPVMKFKIWLFQVPTMMEICLIPKTEFASQYPGLFMFTTPARMMRPVKNLALDSMEMIGSFEQVYMDICINQNEAIPDVRFCYYYDKILKLFCILFFSVSSDLFSIL